MAARVEFVLMPFVAGVDEVVEFDAEFKESVPELCGPVPDAELDLFPCVAPTAPPTAAATIMTAMAARRKKNHFRRRPHILSLWGLLFVGVAIFSSAGGR